MIVAYTMVRPDGVTDLKWGHGFEKSRLYGRFHILAENGELLKFDTIKDAKDFIAGVGEDPEDGFIDYAEVDADNVEHDLYRDGSRVEGE